MRLLAANGVATKGTRETAFYWEGREPQRVFFRGVRRGVGADEVYITKRGDILAGHTSPGIGATSAFKDVPLVGRRDIISTSAQGEILDGQINIEMRMSSFICQLTEESCGPLQSPPLGGGSEWRECM